MLARKAQRSSLVLLKEDSSGGNGFVEDGDEEDDHHRAKHTKGSPALPEVEENELSIGEVKQVSWPRHGLVRRCFGRHIYIIL